VLVLVRSSGVLAERGCTEGTGRYRTRGRLHVMPRPLGISTPNIDRRGVMDVAVAKRRVLGQGRDYGSRRWGVVRCIVWVHCGYLMLFFFVRGDGRQPSIRPHASD